MIQYIPQALAFMLGLSFIICGIIMIAIDFPYWFPHAFIVVVAGVMLVQLSIKK
jgi:hypothetical protein